MAANLRLNTLHSRHFLRHSYLADTPSSSGTGYVIVRLRQTSALCIPASATSYTSRTEDQELVQRVLATFLLNFSLPSWGRRRRAWRVQFQNQLTTSCGRRMGAWRVHIFITLKTGYTSPLTTDGVWESTSSWTSLFDIVLLNVTRINHCSSFKTTWP